MGTNVSLTLAVAGTTITSATYNQNLNNINNAGSFTFTTGVISQIGSMTGAGSGVYTTTCSSTGVNIAAVMISWFTSSVSTENQTITQVGDVTFNYASTAGKTFKALFYKV